MTSSRNPDRLVRTTVHLPARLMERVRAIAEQRGITAAAVIRNAVERVVGAHRPPPRGGIL